MKCSKLMSRKCSPMLADVVPLKGEDMSVMLKQNIKFELSY